MPTTKLPSRFCHWTKSNGSPCQSKALAFIEEPVCGTHATEEQRAENRRLWDIWVTEQARYEDEEPPDDVIVARLNEDYIQVTFGYRPDAVKALSKIAGARYIRDEKFWAFPLHRLTKVYRVCERYFSEIVLEGDLPDIEED